VSRRSQAQSTPQPEPADTVEARPDLVKTEPVAPPSAARSPAAWALLIAVTAAGAAIDLASKHLAFARIAGAPVAVHREHVLALAPGQLNAALIPPHEPVVVLPWILEFKLLLNPGAVFGVGPGQRWFFVAFTLLAIAAAIYMFARWTTPRHRLTHVALGLILAGGLGNLYDRLVHGCVRDFLHPLPNVPMPFGLAWPTGETDLWPWVSNVADAFLLIGIGVLMVKLWRSDDDPKTAPRDQVDDAETPA
jgi:signal peptidase II